MKVAIRVFDEDERRYLETVLDLASRRLKIALEHVASGVAEVVFLKEDEPGASLLINASLVRRHPIVVVYGGVGHPWTLEKPATSRGLVDLLGRILQDLQSHGLAAGSVAPTVAAPAVAATTQPARPAASPAAVVRPAVAVAAPASASQLMPLMKVSHGQSFMERVREIAASGGYWRCRLESGLFISIDAAAGKVSFPLEYASRITELGRHCLDITDQAILRTAPGEQESGGASNMPLESFLWLIAQVAEPFLQDADEGWRTRSFRLQRWPSFSRILHSSSHIVMSGRLMKRAMTVAELAEASGESLENAVRFYNSACICGLLQGNSAVAAPVSQIVVARDGGTQVDAAQLQEIRNSKAGIFSRVLKRLLG